MKNASSSIAKPTASLLQTKSKCLVRYKNYNECIAENILSILYIDKWYSRSKSYCNVLKTLTAKC